MTDIPTRLAALTAMDKNGLLACPCGGHGVLVRQPSRASREYQVRLRCSKCRIQTANRFDQAECASIWNARASALIALAQEAVGEIERLRAVLTSIEQMAEATSSADCLAEAAREALNPQEAAP